MPREKLLENQAMSEKAAQAAQHTRCDYRVHYVLTAQMEPESQRRGRQERGGQDERLSPTRRSKEGKCRRALPDPTAPSYSQSLPRTLAHSSLSNTRPWPAGPPSGACLLWLRQVHHGAPCCSPLWLCFLPRLTFWSVLMGKVLRSPSFLGPSN